MNHIVIASHEFPPRIGGAGVVARDLATSLARGGECRVTIITCYASSLVGMFRKHMVFEELDGYRIIRIPVYKGMWFLSYPYMLNNVLPDDCDLLVFNDVAISYLNDKYRDITVVHYLHGKERYLRYSGFIKSTLLSFDKIFRKNLNNADYIICVSEFIKGWLVNTNVLNNKDKIKVLENRIDTSLFYKAEEIPVRYKLNLGGHVLISASRLVEGKGYERMLRLFNEMVQEGCNDLKWIVVGDGDYRNQFETNISDLGLDDKVLCIGRVDREKLLYLYSQADLFWLLSDFEEAYPLVYKEAIACGLPALGNDLGGVREVISHGVDGFVCSNDADVKSLILDRTYCNLTGIRDVGNFDDTRFGKDFIELICSHEK